MAKQKQKKEDQTTKFEAIYNNGSSVIVAKSAKSEKEFQVAMYSEEELEKVHEAQEELRARKAQEG